MVKKGVHWVFCVIILFWAIESGKTQHVEQDTVDINHWPAVGLMAAGLAVTGTTVKQNLQSDLQDFFGTTTSDIDDYLAMVPSAQVLIYGLIPKHEDRLYHLENYAYSTIINLGLTYGMKAIFNVERPNGGDFSFPSGHTSFAFSTATASYMAFKDKKPLIAWASYLPATITGIMRIQKNRHWTPDVLFGAGLGIITTQLTYRFLRPHRHDDESKFLSNLHFDIGPGQIGLVYKL